jgi:hypothetical protein
MGRISYEISEPQRTRTSNLLIKRHEPHILSGTTDPPPISDIQKYSRDLCFALYLLLCSVAKFVGKMLATLLRLLRQNN